MRGGFLLFLAACGTGGLGGEKAPGGGGETAEPVVDGGVLVGDPADAAWVAIPALTLPAPDPADIEDAGALGIVANRLALWPAEGATVADVNGALGGIGATVIGGDPAIGWLVVQLAPDELEAAWAAAEGSGAFEAVTFDLVHPAQILAPAHASPGGLAGDAAWEWTTLDGGSNWGLKFVHAPAAWNWRPWMHGAWDGGPRLVVIDNGFGEHADLSFAAGSDLEAAPETWHGTEVASVFAGAWNNFGAEGVFPASAYLDEERQSTQIFATKSTSTMGNVQALAALLNGAALDEVPLVANQSLGSNYFGQDESGRFTFQDPDSPMGRFEKTFREANEQEGKAWLLFAERFAGVHGWDRWLLVCSAGNSNIDGYVAERTGLSERRVTAAENSGCGWAAAHGHRNFLAVENLARPGDVLEHVSHRAGNLAAPGEELALASRDNGYITGGGTSYASPMVAGAAAVLWSLEPDTAVRDLRAALLDGAMPAVTDSAPRLDVFGAILVLDAQDGDPDLVRKLVDIDDGTADGWTRLDRSGAVVVDTGTGDACVDLHDLRALRDAILDSGMDGDANPALDGDLRHSKRDWNRDGVSSHGVPTPDTVGADTWFSRVDLDGNGFLDDDDLAVLGAHWGTCWGTDSNADTGGWEMGQLTELLSSVDLWVDVSGGEAITVTATGDRPRVLRPGVVEVDGDHAVLTVPYDGCGGDFVVHTWSVSGGNRTWQPSVAVAPGNDLEVGGGAAADLDFSFPLAFSHSAGGTSETLVYDAGSPRELADPGTEMLPSQEGILAFMGREGVDFQDAGGSWRIPIADTIDDFVPWSWAPSGRALLAWNYTVIDWDEDWWAYVDLDREQGWILDPTVRGDAGDWPFIDPAGTVWMSGADGHIYTITPPPVGIDDFGDFLNELVGLVAPTCDATASPTAAPAAVRFDNVTGWDAVVLARAEPSARSPSGFIAAKGVTSGGRTDLVLLSPDGTTAVTVREGWIPRGGADAGFLGALPDYVSWSGEGRYLAFGDTDGIWVADLGESYWEFPTSSADLTITHMTSRLGAIVFAPVDTRLMVVEYQGPASEPRADVTIVTVDGTEVVTYLHGPRYGEPGWSGMGATLVITDPTDFLTRPDLQVVSAYRDEVVWETGTWRSETGGRSVEQFPEWGRTIRAY